MNIIDTPTRREFRDDRFYTIDGSKYLPSVTTVLSTMPNPELQRWIENTPKDERARLVNDGKQRGTNVHNGIESLLDGLKISLDDYSLEEWKMIIKAVEVIKRYEVKPIWIEKMLFSELLGYAGTADLICELNGENWLLDWKTNNYPDEHKWNLQLVAYKDAIEKEMDIKIAGCAVVHLNSKVRTEKEWQGKGWRMYLLDNEEEYRWEFRDVLKMYWRTHPDIKPNDFSVPLELSLGDI